MIGHPAHHHPPHHAPEKIKHHHAVAHHKAKNFRITYTHLVIALGALILSSALAYASMRLHESKEIFRLVAGTQYTRACEHGKFQAVDYICTSGDKGQTTSKRCLSERKLQVLAKRDCSARVFQKVGLGDDERENDDEVFASSKNKLKTNLKHLPDLYVSKIFDDVDTHTATIVIANRGTVRASQLSPSDDGLVIEWTNPRLDKKERVVQYLPPIREDSSIEVQIPFSKSFSPTDVSVVVDSKNEIKELDENNNFLLGEIFEGYPNISLSGEKLSLSYSGQNIKFAVRLLNTGAEFMAKSASYKIEILGEDGSVLEKTNVPVTSLFGGQEKVFETSFVLPDGARFVHVVLPYQFSPSKGEQGQVFEIDRSSLSSENE